MNTKDWTISAIITIVGGLFVAVVGGLLLHAILNKLNKKKASVNCYRTIKGIVLFRYTNINSKCY